MKLKINRDMCIGCGTCTVLCPEIFELDPAFKARLKDGADLEKPCAKDAQTACPVGAITAEE